MPRTHNPPKRQQRSSYRQGEGPPTFPLTIRTILPFMERFVFFMDRIAVGHGPFCFLHGAFFRRSWSGCPFDLPTFPPKVGPSVGESGTPNPELQDTANALHYYSASHKGSPCESRLGSHASISFYQKAPIFNINRRRLSNETTTPSKTNKTHTSGGRRLTFCLGTQCSLMG